MARRNTKISFNLDGLEEMNKAMGDKYVTRVGILAGAGMHHEAETVNVNGKEYRKKVATPSKLSNAEIGVIHEFGSEKRSIPPRSFLRLPLETKRDEVMRAMGGRMIKEAFESGKYKRVFALLGLKAEQIIQDAFASGGFGQWPDLSDKTVKRKGSSAPLIDTAQLRRSITSDVVSKQDAR